jgi:drug/metabolite transporter (DMT)-like permease
MIFLIFSIISSVIIVVIFKTTEHYSITLFPVIIVNYLTAVVWSIIALDNKLFISQTIHKQWLPIGFAIGIILIALFFVVGYTTKKMGISKTIISAKLSVILPISFSFLYFNESVDTIKILGIITGIAAVFLTLYPNTRTKFNTKHFILPLVLFVGMGTLDLLIKYTQQTYLSPKDVALFTLVSFASAGLAGTIFTLFKPNYFRMILIPKTLLFGFILGSSNFGSMYFLILALQKTHIGSAAVFGINNVAIILVSVLAAFAVFKEKITYINAFGIVVSMVSILLLSRIF